MFRIIFLIPIFLTGCASGPSAEQLLANYLEVSDSGQLDRLDELLAGEALDSARHANQILIDLDLQQVGSTSFYAFESVSDTQYHFCLDVSATQLIDAAGVDVTPSDRPLQVPMMMRVTNGPEKLLINQLDVRRYSSC